MRWTTLGFAIVVGAMLWVVIGAIVYWGWMA
jgi:hypothetical protein